MARSDAAIIPFPKLAPAAIADDCHYQAAAEYRAALLAKLLKRLPPLQEVETASELLADLVELYRQAIIQAQEQAKQD